MFCSIIMHDIGGNTIQNQYKRGIEIAASILQELGYEKNFVQEASSNVRTHHDHHYKPSLAFKILYDSNKLVMFSLEEFPYYNPKLNFSWNEIIDLIYHRYAKELEKDFWIKEELRKNQLPTSVLSIQAKIF